MEAIERWQPLQARERPLRVGGSVREQNAECREALIRGSRNRPLGSGTAVLSELFDAVFGTVHAGGEQGWESDHLEPFLFCRAGHIHNN